MPSKQRQANQNSPSVVHRLLRVVRLEHAPVRREGPDREVVLFLFVVIEWKERGGVRGKERGGVREKEREALMFDQSTIAQGIFFFPSLFLLLARKLLKPSGRRSTHPTADARHGASSKRREERSRRKRGSEREKEIVSFSFQVVMLSVAFVVDLRPCTLDRGPSTSTSLSLNSHSFLFYVHSANVAPFWL